MVVSPPQIEVPEIRTAGKEIRVELKDSLKPGMTYTIDFSDAISFASCELSTSYGGAATCVTMLLGGRNAAKGLTRTILQDISYQ